MTKKNSWSYEMDIESFKRWIRASAIMFAPALLLTIDQFTTWNYDFTAIKVAVMWCIIDYIRRYLKDYSK